MKRDQKLWSSVSLLIVAVLAITCFTTGALKTALYIGVFFVWGIYAFVKYVVPMIRRYKYSKEVRQIMKQGRLSKNDDNTNIPIWYKTLLCHVNHRITGYIKSIYPDATWKWITENPASIVANGGTGRIELYNVNDYNFADISFDTDANIECSLLKVVNYSQAAQTEAMDSTVNKPKSCIDPQVWFEKSGRVVLKNLIADLSSRGHNTLTIQDDGSCVIKQGEKTIEISRLESFPERVYHPNLIKVLAGAGIAAKSVDAGLAISW